jgi:hypothetical protein
MEEKYLSAAQLGIEEWERDELKRFICRVEHQTIIPALFDMNNGCKKNECGTVACIGGYVAEAKYSTIAQRDGYVMMKDDDRASLYKLYFPRCLKPYEWDKITLGDAVKAVHNFLLTGKPSWKKIRPDLVID